MQELRKRAAGQQQQHDGETAAAPRPVTPPSDHPSSEIACAICFEPPSASQANAPAMMPCCGRSSGTTRFCVACIDALCVRAGAHRVGACPNCRAAITVDRAKATGWLLRDGAMVVGAGGVVRCRKGVGVCGNCRQTTAIARTVRRRGADGGNLEDVPLCAPCVLGAAHPLVFECAACAQPQRIAHPLWRTQRTELAFSTATWACNNPGCPGAAAMPGQRWRVRDEEQLVQIPAGEFQAGHLASWGFATRDEWLVALRAGRVATPTPLAQGGRWLLAAAWRLCNRVPGALDWGLLLRFHPRPERSVRGALGLLFRMYVAVAVTQSRFANLAMYLSSFAVLAGFRSWIELMHPLFWSYAIVLFVNTVWPYLPL